MQTISGSVGLSLATKGANGSTESSTGEQVDMASGLGFLALFSTQIDSASSDSQQPFDLAEMAKLMTGQAHEMAEFEVNPEDLSGNILPPTLPLAAMLAKKNIDSDKVLSQLIGAAKGELLDDKLFSNLGNELKSVKSLLDGLQQGQGDPSSTLIQGLAQAAGNSGLRGQSPQAGMPGFTTIASQLGDQAWGDELVSKVKWQVGQELQEAKIHLNPRELGPLQIKISINDDQASVQFIAQHGVVRDAIEDAMPRLREMLEQSGLNLADANVSQGSEDEQQAFSEGADGEKQNNRQGSEDDLGVEQTEGIVKSGLGLVDAFV